MACLVGISTLFDNGFAGIRSVASGICNPSRDVSRPKLQELRPTCATHLPQWKAIMDGRYEIDVSKGGILGEGTSCICRRGRVKDTGHSVAIKVYREKGERLATLTRQRRFVAVLQSLQEPFERPSDPKLWSSQLDEVQPAQLFMHLLDYSKDDTGKPSHDPVDGKLYVITELGQQSLKDFIDARREACERPSKEMVRSIAHSIMLVLAGLHAKGFVHLDIKPENLMVFDGCLKLIDVDGCVEMGTPIGRRDHSISFSPAYCAPEFDRFLLNKNPSPLCANASLDVWSCGCIVAELVTLDAMFVSKFTKISKRTFKSQGDIAAFMRWMTRLDRVTLPKTIKQLDPELAEFVTGSLLVICASGRKTCAEALDNPLFSGAKMMQFEAR